jgi:outer membrane murein-binding lipoprotein Lpp
MLGMRSLRPGSRGMLGAPRARRAAAVTAQRGPHSKGRTAGSAQQGPHRRVDSRVSAEPTRRVLLGGAVAGTLLLAGCKGISALGPVPPVGADVMTLDHAIRAEELMVARYRAAQAAAGGGARTAGLVSRLLAEHTAHLAALRSRLVLPSRLATASPQPSPTPPALPAQRHAALAALKEAEQAAVVRLTGQLLTVPPALAQLMASIAASETAHVVLLDQAGAA